MTHRSFGVSAERRWMALTFVSYVGMVLLSDLNIGECVAFQISHCFTVHKSTFQIHYARSSFFTLSSSCGHTIKLEMDINGNIFLYAVCFS